MFGDYVARSLRLGAAWPLNDFGLRSKASNGVFELDSGAVVPDTAEDELQGRAANVTFDAELPDSPCLQVRPL